MAVLIPGRDVELVRLTVIGAHIGRQRDPVYGYPFPLPGGVFVKYANRVWDTMKAGGSYHVWHTFLVDVNGTQYDGPGAYGVDTSDHSVQTIVFDRSKA